MMASLNVSLSFLQITLFSSNGRPPLVSTVLLILFIRFNDYSNSVLPQPPRSSPTYFP